MSIREIANNQALRYMQLTDKHSLFLLTFYMDKHGVHPNQPQASILLH